LGALDVFEGGGVSARADMKEVKTINANAILKNDFMTFPRLIQAETSY
jgi:hypothetical protein